MTLSPAVSSAHPIRRLRPPALLLVHVLALSAVAAVPGTAAMPRAAGTPTITAPASVDAGTRVTISGKAPSGASVVVQRKQGRAFVTLGRARATSKGTWKTTVRFPSAGTTTVRAVAGGKPSATRTVDVYAWLDLATQSMFSDTVARDIPIEMGATVFPHSLQVVRKDYFFAYWKTDRQCTDLRLTVGFPDEERSPEVLDEAGFLVADTFPPDRSDGPRILEEQRIDWTAPRTVSARGLQVAELVLLQTIIDEGDADRVSIGLGRPQARCKVATLPPIVVSDLP